MPTRTKHTISSLLVLWSNGNSIQKTAGFLAARRHRTSVAFLDEQQGTHPRRTGRTAMTACCHGRILATPLVNPAQEVLRHTYIQPPYRIDPHKLKRGAGSLRHRQQQHTKNNDSSMNDVPPAQDQHSEMFEGMEAKNSQVRLDVFLYDPEHLGVAPLEPGTALHLELNRKADEPVLRSLQRLNLNIQKKLVSAQQKQQPKSKKRTQGIDPLVWTVLGEKSSLMDVSELTNIDFCRQSLSSDSNVVVELKLGGVREDNEVTQLMLSFEACLPTVTSVKTFEEFNSRLFAGVPLTVSVETLYATHSQVEWYIDSKWDKTTVKQNGVHSHVPAESDIGKAISILVKPLAMEHDTVRHDGAGAEHAFQFERRIEARPENFILNLRHDWLKQERKLGFRFLTYNILADQNAFSGAERTPLNPYVSADVLDKRRRMPLILHEIITYDAEVVCLQEVDEAVYQSLFLPALTSLGFQGFYTSKASDGTREGCAMFWSLSKFLPVDTIAQLSYPIRDLVKMVDESSDCDSDATIHGLLCESPDLQSIISERLGHVVQLVRLQEKDEPTQNPLWVSNTHLFFHPLASHIRLLQAYLISKRVGLCLSESPGDLVMTGDFNSSLHNAAGKLLLDRSIPHNFRDTKTHLNTYRWEKDDEPEASADDTERQEPKDFPGIAVSDNFPTLQSAVTPEPEFTHLIASFSGTLDHVLLSSTIQCLSYAPMPRRIDVTSQVAMPSPEIPSDHVCIVCDLAR